MKDVRVVLSQDAMEVYEYLNEQSSVSKIDRSLFNAIQQKISLIKSNPHYGNPISKKLIPLDYIEKYGIKNLFRVEFA